MKEEERKDKSEIDGRREKREEGRKGEERR
jgi:hypothetical protein